MRILIVRAACALMTAIGLAMSWHVVEARPYVPEGDAVVLERLPEKIDPSLAELKRLRVMLARRPGDLELATRLARRAIDASRETGDPRFLGQAQAALATWWTRTDAPRDVLVLRATIRQSLHDFPAALADLDRVLGSAPLDAQARLTRASVLTVIGRHADAIRDCDALAGRTLELVVATCRAGALELMGDASAYPALMEALRRAARVPSPIVVWTQTLAGEMAARAGDASSAEQHFRRALTADPRDAYLRATYADFLMDRQRPREVITLIGTDVANDTLLLRVALAEAQLTDPTAEERGAARDHRLELGARFAASRARGDVVHRREEARYALHLEHDARRALELARANWDVQREPADLRILTEAARATKNRATLELVDNWQRQHPAREMQARQEGTS